MTILEWLKTRETKKKLREQNKFLQDQVETLLSKEVQYANTQVYRTTYMTTPYNDVPSFVIEERLKRNLYDQIENNIKIEQREGLGGLRMYYAEISVAKEE